jgi:hypothetical protein
MLNISNYLGGDRKMQVHEIDLPQLDDIITTYTVKGQGESIIGRLPCGIVILFDKEAKIAPQPGDTVESQVKHVAENYIIVDPIRILEEREAVISNLDQVAGSDYFHHSALANGIRFLIEALIDD